MSDKQTKHTNEGTHKNAETLSNAANGNEDSSSLPISTQSVEPSNIWKGRWRQPKNARQFASQVNAVSTLLLNGSIDLEQARAYAALARVVSQSLSVEVTKNRFLRKETDLIFDEDILDGERSVKP